ncbi:MAG TPA: glycosyltransferase, partial [Kineosporiaceae bacterium]|nr:glycosyltransferase [Kineosporiaceae bacterium]
MPRRPWRRGRGWSGARWPSCREPARFRGPGTGAAGESRPEEPSPGHPPDHLPDHPPELGEQEPLVNGSSLSVLLAGGGTTGHVAPLLALADCLVRRDPGTRVTALGTAEGLEARLVP